jgi:hypothetical protein
VKTAEAVRADVERRLTNTWNTNLEGDSPHWPHTFSLGAASRADLETAFSEHQRQSLALRAWADRHNLALADTPRRVHGTTQPIPTHITVADIDTAARLCGPQWVTRLARGRRRLAELRTRGFAGDLPRIVRDVDGYSDLDFDLLCSTAEWFRHHGETARGLTPRQVPVPGLQAKWLNTRHAVVATLAGTPELGLLPPHPARIHFTYLDPDHLAASRRRHDSASVGDTMTPAYTPLVVIITENKDTAIGFPQVPGGIAVEGAGAGGGTAAAIDWLRRCPNVIYWGDMDADGLAILNQHREAGLAVASILMDIPTYDTYAAFGTNHDVKGNPITVSARRKLDKLTDSERELYDRLTDPAWRGYRRVEQERIPLDVALDAVLNEVHMARRVSLGG